MSPGSVPSRPAIDSMIVGKSKYDLPVAPRAPSKRVLPLNTAPRSGAYRHTELAGCPGVLLRVIGNGYVIGWSLNSVAPRQSARTECPPPVGSVARLSTVTSRNRPRHIRRRTPISRVTTPKNNHCTSWAIFAAEYRGSSPLSSTTRIPGYWPERVFAVALPAVTFHEDSSRRPAVTT